MSFGTIVIGRNEGHRLTQCLTAALQAGGPVVYVDSASNDGSPLVARRLGAEVIELSTPPHTAARGRQAGFDFLTARHPSMKYVQFVDGDCVIDGKWLFTAPRFLEANPKVAAVSGRRREEHTAESFWSRLIDLDWDIPAGLVGYPGGDSLCRVDAIKLVGGWDVDLIAGEDPDLGFRLCDAGWRVSRLADEMTRHDMRIVSLGQYMKRAVRSGHAYAEIGWRHRRGSGNLYARRAAGIFFYAAVLPAVAAIGLVLWPPSLLLPLLIYLRLLWSGYRLCRRKAATNSLALAYSALNLLCKFAGLLGAAKFCRNFLAGKRTPLIEYRSHSVGPPGISA